jgi:hypothetical protein
VCCQFEFVCAPLKHAVGGYPAFVILNPSDLYVEWVPCYHSVACPQVANRGDGFQMWRVAAIILNKQSRTADRWWPSSLGVGQG